MAITAYTIAVGAPAALNTTAATLITGGWQPAGPLVLQYDGTLAQSFTQGTADTGVPTGSVVLANGATVAVVNSASGDSHNATATVTGTTLTNVKFASTIAMVDSADTVVVHNSAGTNVAGTHTAEVAVGALTDVKLAATVAPVTSGQVLTGVTPTGTFITSVTFTVANGVITAIVLS